MSSLQFLTDDLQPDNFHDRSSRRRSGNSALRVGRNDVDSGYPASTGYLLLQVSIFLNSVDQRL